MLSIIYFVYSLLLYKKETSVMTGFFARRGVNESWAKNLAFVLFLAEYFALRFVEHAFMLHKLF